MDQQLLDWLTEHTHQRCLTIGKQEPEQKPPEIHLHQHNYYLHEKNNQPPGRTTR